LNVWSKLKMQGQMQGHNPNGLAQWLVVVRIKKMFNFAARFVRP